MSIASELTRLASNIGTMQADVNATIDAIEAAGVTTPQNVQLSDAPVLIGQIGTGQKFMYLTYFDNFDTTTGIDTPVIGASSVLLDTNKTFSVSTDTISSAFVGQTPVLNVYCPTNDVMHEGIAIQPDGDYTVEWYAKCTSVQIPGESAPQVFIWLGSYVAVHTTDSGYIEFLYDTTGTYELYNGAVLRDDSWNMKWYRCSSEGAASLYTHYKLIIKANGDYMFFVNGELKVVTHGTFQPATKMRIDPRTGATITLTQVAIYSRSWPYGSWT